jgi:hypothetical protein
MTQTTWERGRRYLVNGREFLYMKDALGYARYIFKSTGVVAGIQSIYKE